MSHRCPHSDAENTTGLIERRSDRQGSQCLKSGPGIGSNGPFRTEPQVTPDINSDTTVILLSLDHRSDGRGWWCGFFGSLGGAGGVFASGMWGLMGVCSVWGEPVDRVGRAWGRAGPGEVSFSVGRGGNPGADQQNRGRARMRVRVVNYWWAQAIERVGAGSVFVRGSRSVRVVGTGGFGQCSRWSGVV